MACTMADESCSSSPAGTQAVADKDHPHLRLPEGRPRQRRRHRDIVFSTSGSAVVLDGTHAPHEDDRRQTGRQYERLHRHHRRHVLRERRPVLRRRRGRRCRRPQATYYYHSGARARIRVPGLQHPNAVGASAWVAPTAAREAGLLKPIGKSGVNARQGRRRVVTARPQLPPRSPSSTWRANCATSRAGPCLLASLTEGH